ncbi:glycosyltransferase family 2 protein [Leptolyngbya iicbica]|uniref:Glycosyltransferase family 2 protein n=2 Tax=Cyanophyceae TaxID=3028117 RepID=A0A4Q7EHP6_9CYAN|nr:glycosyltransferase family 2 protein [Leptolyngbya sp. LK]RZM82895.1 glycosyltransferase family 2 protein [Leptolyngbya sp. LK]
MPNLPQPSQFSKLASKFKSLVSYSTSPSLLKHKVKSLSQRTKSLSQRTIKRLRYAEVSQPQRTPSETFSASYQNLTTEQFRQILDPLLIAHSASIPIDDPPIISILTPTYNSSLDWFVETVLSVLNQTSHAWEWCLVDDGSSAEDIRTVLTQLTQKHPRIRVAFQTSGGISAATNKALDMAYGQYVCFLDHDDTLVPHAIERSLQELEKGFDFVYSDEDKIDGSGQYYIEPFLKPDWSPEYLRGVMYVGHLLCVRKQHVLDLGGLDSQYDGVQDYELALRLSESALRVGHISEVLYHWRKIPGSIAADVRAKPKIEQLQQAAVNAHLKRLALPATAQQLGNHRIKLQPAVKDTYPLVSIIIPTKDAPHHLERCLNSLFAVSTYPNFEVVIVDNETSDPKALQLMQEYPIKRLLFPYPFHYSKANNLGAQYAQGDYLIFLNNDTEIVAKDWVQNLLYYAEQPDVGAAGALLLYPNHTVQHAGVVMGIRGTADHIMRGFPVGADGYAGSLVCAREVSAVTAACMMVKNQDFNAVVGFSEHYFHHYQDADLCMRLLHLGKRNIVVPEATLIHHESATRKEYYDLVDRYFLLDQWQDYIEAGDPFYNPGFALDRFDYSIKVT